MLRKILIALFLSTLLLSCRAPERGLRSDDLTRSLAFTELVPDTQIILFGLPESRFYLVSGWSNPEKQGGESFRWAVEQNPVLAFKTVRRGPLYLHIRASSFFPNSAEVLVNRKPVGTLRVQREADESTLTIPQSVLNSDANAVEFRFAEARPPENKTDARKLAAAFYSVIVTPSKYVAAIPAGYPKESLWKTDTLLLEGKNRRVLASSAGLSWYLHEKLSPGMVLRFGALFKPSPFSEEDDFAAFSVYLRRDGAPEQQIFSSRFTAASNRNVELPLDPYVTGKDDAIAELELRMERNSIFDSGITAWVDPTLTRRETPAPQVHTDQLEALRRANRGANVVFILLDAGGAKHFSGYGYFRDTTPVIDALARENIRFQHGYTNAVYTLASTGTLMSGLDPLHHRIITRKSRLPADAIALSERFDGAGYSTGTFVANGNASGIFGMTQGFQEIREVFRDPNYTGWAKDITNSFTGWLDSRPRKPFFAYLHYREPHGPFNPPPEWKFKYVDPNYHGIAAQGQDIRKAINFGTIDYTQADKDYITALYDANLNYADFEVGRVLKKLKDLGIYDNTIVIVTADHGEAFWEHNFQGHNSQLYEESVHIPIILKLTKQSGIQGRTIEGFVRTMDYYPTLVDLLDFSRRGMKVDGRSILPYLASAPDDGRPVITQTIMEQQYSYRQGDYKYIVRLSNRAEELYDLKSDPGEKRNILAEQPVHASYYRSRLLGWLSESRRLGGFQKGERAIMDEAAKENLEALGYLDE